MKKTVLTFLLLLTITLSKAQILDIPDANFKNAMVNLISADFNGDLTPDDDVDTNNDGEIQLSEAEAVIGLIVTQQNIASLEGISNFTNIEYLNVWDNDLTSLDVSNLSNLNNLFCPKNLLTSIDLSQNVNLQEFICWENNLTDLDISQNSLIHRFSCRDNNLSNLNIQNGNNSSFTLMWSYGNPNLLCIQIDDASEPHEDPIWRIDPTASYSENCSLSIEEFAKSLVTLYPNPAKESINVQSLEQIKEIKIYSMPGNLVQVFSEFNGIIDISNLPNGIYFVQVIFENGSTLSKKIIKS
jgi:hypothetical protein